MKYVLSKSLLIVLLFFTLQEIYYTQVPYVPTPQEVVDGMLALAEVKQNDMVYDLGCGDGRIVVTAAKKYGARGVGIDNNPERIKDSEANAKQNGVTNKVNFREQNLFETDLSNATVVTLYLLSEINLKLRPKLFKELKPGTRIVSHSFDMDDWEPDVQKSINGRSIYYWKIPANVSGNWEWAMQSSKSENYSLQLDQQFQKVKGKIHIGGEEYDLIDPKLDGDKLEFSFNRNINGKLVKAKFKGEMKGNELSGTVDNTKITAARKQGTMKPLVTSSN